MSTNYFLRLEARTRGSELEPGVAARVYDPAWMLARQWQIGELLGEDAGSPIGIELEAEIAKLACYGPSGSKKRSPYDPMVLPLEALVESEPLRSTKTWTARMRIDAGREFLQALRTAGAGAYVVAFRSEYGIERASVALRESDPAGARLIDVAARRLPDGEVLYREFSKAMSQNRLPDQPKIAMQDIDSVREAALTWIAWSKNILHEGDGAAWIPERLEHGFNVATGDDSAATVLDAAEYRGGRLDWYSFDARPVTTPSGFTKLDPIEVLPAGVRFRGMPNARWWEFEDASIDMGSVDAGASDAARLALLEFALLYGNDFFAVPLRLPVGSLTRINSLVVTDSFGMKLLVESAARGTQRVGASRWTMFTLAERKPGTQSQSVPADVLFLPPIVGPILSGAPVEDVLLLRDEMANLAWAVERKYEGESGAAIERAESSIRQHLGLPSPTANTTIRYRLGTSVPPHWLALVPVQRGGELLLDLQRMADQQTNALAVPRGRFLNLKGPAIHEEEVPREGARLLRDYVMARWIDGSTLVWSRRRKRLGSGEGSSGLRFDVTEPDVPETVS